MAYISLYRKFRPITWDKVIGQDHIVTTLTNQIKHGTIGHAYLFTGTRGTGKTSTAKIFARAVNCLQPIGGSPCRNCEVCLSFANPTSMDIIEMDAASNNGVDEIRELRENIQYPPTVGRYKVYIIDEVHMLSTQAFNALLKTLEEPPVHAIFILATTEAHKLPSTILSRCMRFDFRLVARDELVKLLSDIFNAEKYTFDTRALELLAMHGEGSVRDTLSVADMCMSYAPEYLSYDAVLEVLGSSDFNVIKDISAALLAGNIGDVLARANEINSRGKSVSTINKEITEFFRDMIAIKNIDGYKANFNDTQYDEIYQLSNGYDNYRIGRIFDIMSSVENLLRYSTQPKIIFDAALVKASELVTEPNIEALLSRVRMLENKISAIENMDFTPLTVAENKNIETSKKVSSQPSNKSINTTTDTSIIDGKNDISSHITQFAKSVDSQPVFSKEDTQDTQKEDYLAKQIWGNLLTKIREEQYNFLYFALQNQEDMTLSDNTLILKVKDIPTIELLSTDSNSAIIDSLLKSVMGDGYSFSFITGQKDAVVVQQDRLALHELFGDKLKDSNKK